MAEYMKSEHARSMMLACFTLGVIAGMVLLAIVLKTGGLP